MNNSATARFRVPDFGPGTRGILFKGVDYPIHFWPHLPKLPILQENRLALLEARDQSRLYAIVIFLGFGVLGKDGSSNRLAGFFKGANQALREGRLCIFVNVKGAGVSNVR